MLVTSFDAAAIAAVRRAAPDVRTGLLSMDQDNPRRAIVGAVEGGHNAVMPHYTMIDDAFMELARAAGLFVGTWTVNDPDDMIRLVELGVDALISDVPDVALTAVRAATRPADG